MREVGAPVHRRDAISAGWQCQSCWRTSCGRRRAKPGQGGCTSIGCRYGVALSGQIATDSATRGSPMIMGPLLATSPAAYSRQSRSENTIFPEFGFIAGCLICPAQQSVMSPGHSRRDFWQNYIVSGRRWRCADVIVPLRSSNSRKRRHREPIASTTSPKCAQGRKSAKHSQSRGPE